MWHFEITIYIVILIIIGFETTKYRHVINIMLIHLAMTQISQERITRHFLIKYYIIGLKALNL